MRAEPQPGLFNEEGNRVAGSRSGSLNGQRPSAVKNYVLDTNVLLHDPHSVYRFTDNHVWIPIDVLSELDKFKNELTKRGVNARAVTRFLTRCFHQNGRAVRRGVKTPGGGTIRIAVNEGLSALRTTRGFRRFQQTFQDLDRPDHRILALCLYMKDKLPERTILVTKDLNMRLKALAIGLEAQDYENDKVEEADVEGYDHKEIRIEGHQMQRFASSRELRLEEGQGLAVNEYVFLAAEDKMLPARHVGGGCLRRLHLPAALINPRGVHLRPLNLGQQCLLDALLDPEIALVTCYGQAGTGKTLLAVAAGLHLYWTQAFSGITVSRPVVAMGNTLGFLPGDLDEKMRPWLQSIYDALELLLPAQPPVTEQGRKARKARLAADPVVAGLGGTGLKPYEQLVEQGCLEIEALCYIRGRSIPNRYFVLDEAQQLTPLEAKTVVTRMSKGSKLVMAGDPAQIDHPYVDSRSNGLVYTRNRLKGQAITAHVCLTKGERSVLAEAGANLM
ncbi:MAG: PhoH family protein [Verrucomicrobia bacterium]|nr:PhoH family protein [Verrucomicrobiota bacterium]